ncbi:hypothetical protein FRB90_003215 [Tulasnella sp. 427]|nr:hypothetical protein FRB90_003215 [Tulasnella sp. 427]
MTESSQAPPAPSKPKAFVDYFRSRGAETAPASVSDDAKAAAEPSSSGKPDTAAAGLSEKRKISSYELSLKSGLSVAQIERQWDEVIAGAKARTTIFERLKRLGSKDGKSAKAKGKEKESASEPAVEDLAAMIPLPADVADTPAVSTPVPAPTPPANKDSVPGSNTLSKRIQLMLSSIPPFLHTVSDAAQPTPSPVPPLADAKLLGYLSSPEVMNGAEATSTPSGKQRRSVWQVLDQLVPYKQPVVPAADGEEDPEDEASESSLMVCAPLIPDETSKVELAKSAVIEVPDTFDSDGKGLSSKAIANGVAASLWPDKLKLPWWKKKKQPDCDSPTPSPCPTPTPPPAKPQKEVKIWIPSKTQISFQVAWWGYRLWLPPPVMHVLDDKTLEASKRAAMIATAIGWLINNIPTAILPPPLKAAVTLLKAVLPLLGYISGFIAWSWSEVKSFDKGSGVVLSATWLLPIALIPGSWEDQAESIGIGKGDSETRPATPTPDPSKGGSTTTPTNPGSGTAPSGSNPGTNVPANPGTSTPANPGTAPSSGSGTIGSNPGMSGPPPGDISMPQPRL